MRPARALIPGLRRESREWRSGGGFIGGRVTLNAAEEES